MASIFIHFLLLLLNLSLTLSSPIFLPLSKHPLTNLHLTHLEPEPRTNLLLDLNSPFLWLTPTRNQINNVSIIPHHSIPCSSSGIHQSDSHHHCTLPVTNSLTGHTTLGHLVKTRLYHIDNFLLVLAPSPSPGLPTTVKGVLGLGRNRVGVVQQITHSFTLSNTFSICLSSSSRSNGFVLLGEDRQLDMLYTPILASTTKTETDSYRISLRSINIQNNRFIKLTQPSSIKLTTTTPYTLIKTSIYKYTITAFTSATDPALMTRVPPTGGFELCYKIQKNDIKKVPVINLVLQSEMVKWSIHGHNSMVKINDDVMCLGILDGGDELEDVIVLGNHQLEDNLVEFDLGRSMIGFSSSLLAKDTSCSSLRKGLVSRDGNPQSGTRVI